MNQEPGIAKEKVLGAVPRAFLSGEKSLNSISDFRFDLPGWPPTLHDVARSGMRILRMIHGRDARATPSN